MMNSDCSRTLRQLIGICCVLCLSELQAENWPGWRGPRGDGTVDDKRTPTEWDGVTGQNILWKVDDPGRGHSSPIVWQNRIFLTTCVEENQQRLLLCLHRRTGQELWRRVVVKSPLETKHRLNSFASGTPATDGQSVYVTFLVTDGKTVPARNVGTPRPTTTGEMIVAAYDFSGQQQWTARPGPFTSVHGFCSSPVIHNDLLIVNGDHDGNSYIAALDRANGKVRWKFEREHETRSYCTPLIRNAAGKTQMVVSGSHRVVSLNPSSGQPFWTIDGPTEQFVSSMVYDGRRFFLTAGYPTHHVMAIDPAGSGNVTESHVAWHSTKAKCYVPSPVIIGDHLFVADDRGTANSFDTRTGERLWQDRLGKHFSASLIAANGFAYFTADDGITSIVRPGQSLNVVHENRLGEYVFASPAVSNGLLFLRGEEHLFAIGPDHQQPVDADAAP